MRPDRADAHVSDPTAYWDGVARATHERPAALWRLQADLATEELLERWLPPGDLGRVLKTDLYDESCTDGLVPALALRAGAVIGIDVSCVVAQAARMPAPACAVAADVRRLPFRAGSFDVIVSNSTLDHFAQHADIERGLAELERVLAADGILIVTLDNPGHPLVRLRNALAPLLQRLGVVPYAVGATHGARGLRTALEDSGFALVELTAVHHFPRVALVAIERLLGSRGGAAVLRLAHRGEALGRWPTRFLTGQYVAALARPVRPGAASEAAA